MAAHHSAQGLASLGRHGDSMLVHMSPHEVVGLNYLAKKQGTKLTINPETGLPEAFNLGGFFSSLLPMFAGMALGPGAGMMPLLAGAATGAGLAAVKGENPLMGGLMGGLGGYSGANLAGGFGAAAGGAGGAAGTVGANGEIGASLLKSTAGGYTPASVINGVSVPNVSDIAGAMDKSMINTGLNIPQTSMMNSANIINQSGAGAGSALSGASSFNPIQTLKNSYTGAKNVVTGEPGSWDAFKNYFNEAGQAPTTNFQAGMKIAMPLGGAVLGGLEPTDIYGKPMERSDKEKYDPYSTLNLSGDSGLRLYAAGGNISSIGSGGLQDLYGTSDNSGGPQSLSREGYGVGRLEGLTAAGSRAKAADTFYAQGGPVSFADGGDTEGVALEQLSMSPDSAAPSPGGIAALANSAQMNPQGEQASSDINLAAPPTATDGSLITQVANNLQADPNYQPKNPIEAAIVKQLKGTDPMQEGQQGLGSLAPAQAQSSFPAAATYAPAPAMGPTDYSQSSTPYMAKGGYLNGQGDGMSDSIPATIEGKQPARLADGEFVVPADVVSHIGNGSSKAGSKRLYAMLDKVRKARTGHTKQGRQINPNKYMPA